MRTSVEIPNIWYCRQMLTNTQAKDQTLPWVCFEILKPQIFFRILRVTLLLEMPQISLFVSLSSIKTNRTPYLFKEQTRQILLVETMNWDANFISLVYCAQISILIYGYASCETRFSRLVFLTNKLMTYMYIELSSTRNNYSSNLWILSICELGILGIC